MTPGHGDYFLNTINTATYQWPACGFRGGDVEAAPWEQEGEAASSSLAALKGLSLSTVGTGRWGRRNICTSARKTEQAGKLLRWRSVLSKEASAELCKGAQEGREGSDLG